MKLLFEFGRGSSAASRRNQNNVSSDETTHIGDPLLRSDFLSPPGISIHGSRDEVERERERELLMTQQSRRAAAAGLHGEAGNFNINARSKSSARDNRSSYKLKLIGNLLAITSCLSFLIAVPMITYHAMVFDKARPDFAAFYSAGAFVLITLIMSLKIIYNHFTHWYMPDVQKYVVRILWMVPIYATQSWLSLRFHNARIYIDTLRDLYEAYVIQSFLYFLMELLGGEDTLVQILQEKDSHYGIHLGFFKFFIKPWEMGYEFMANCKYGVLQYVVAKCIASIATAALEPIGLFSEGEFSWEKGYIYLSFIINLSQMWALYCLVKFYHATHDNLATPVNWKPLGKFLCIKGVVFFTWWQGVAIAVLKSYDLIGDIGLWDANDVANGLQDYLICVEMFCFSIAHSFTFTHKEYVPGRANSSDFAQMGAAGDEGNTSLDSTEFRPPVIRTLNTPMGFRDAFWSSTVPKETINDIRRFRNGACDQDLNDSSEIGMLRNVSMQHAESV